MSLPREWTHQAARAYAASPLVGSVTSGTSIAASRGQDAIESHALSNMVADPFTETQLDLAGSLFSIHSAPVIELNSDTDSLKRPSSLVIQEINSLSVDRGLDSHTSPPETVEDEDNDNLLTISSLTARPLIAKSHELRSSKLSKKQKHHKQKKVKKVLTCIDDEGIIIPPDGGYGWAIVFGAFLVQFWVAGLVKSYGVLFVEVMETFSDSSASVASWIPAILSCLCLALAPLTSALCQKFSCRSVVFTGGIFCALGLTLSYFATSLVHLFFTFGVLTGIGGGLSTTPGIVMVSQYFDKHRALANGICVSGTAAGSFVFPLLIEHLCEAFGFHGTILLLGGCMLHVCVSATLYKPLKAQKRDLAGTENIQYINTPATEITQQSQQSQAPNTLPASIPVNKQLELLFQQNDTAKISATLQFTDSKTRNNILNDLFNQKTIIFDPANRLSDSEEEKDQIGETILMRPSLSFRSSSFLHSVEDLSTDSTCVYKSRQRDSLSRSLLMVSTTAADRTNLYGPNKVEMQPTTEQQQFQKKTIVQKISQYLDVSLLKDFNFIMMCLSVTLMSTGSPYMLYYLPAYVLSAGFTKTEAGYLVAISAALDLCGRLGLGWLSDLHLFDRRKGYIGSIVGAGVAVLVIPVAGSFYVLACSVGMYGLCLGCWFLLVPVLLADQYGTEKISSSYGLVRMFQSVGAISVPPLAGYMRDVTGGYEYCFYCMGTCMVLGGVPLLLVPVNSMDPKNHKKMFSRKAKESSTAKS
ncbi:monocarboxylate transporter 12 [Chrysoperla carnea]|uniref:monocarboxylate transporter 12 n=1 Tax=Chrysoperla carnea TaxID=189513 RepID=UPI001D062C56|nr:monocarboxylate transporter 12 [Chrysoperla carnea]